MLFTWKLATTRIVLNCGEKMSWNNEINMCRKTLRKISKSCKVWFLIFLISWWSNFIFWMSWWNVIFETQIWSKSQSLTFQCTVDFFHQLTKFHLSIHWSREMNWNMWLGQNDVLEFLRSCFKPISHVLDQKSKIGHSQSKP